MPDPLASRLGREEGKGEERRGGERRGNGMKTGAA